MRTVVGISQKIKWAWIDALLDRLVLTVNESELRTFLDKQLREELPGKESRAKASGIILRIWSSIPLNRIPLRDRAVALLPQISGQERIWLHWGMTALAYPFFRDTAEIIGRLLGLQDDFTTGQVQGRMLTTWGDRATSKEAVQKLITTLVDWEVLRSRKTKGHFLLARKMTASMPELQLWLLEALLRASAADEIEARQLLRLPEAFPFTVSVGVTDLRKYEEFNIHRQGLDMDMVALRPVKIEPPKPRPKGNTFKEEKPRNPVQRSLFEIQSENIAFGNGQLDDRNTIPHVNDNQVSIAEQDKIEEAIKTEVLETLSERATRLLQVRETLLVPDNPFAAPSAECVKQFRDGHYLGCIALTQVVLEALIEHIWRLKLKIKPNQKCTFDKAVSGLCKKKLITAESKMKLAEMWANRHLLHVLGPSVDSQRLAEVARTNVSLLGDLEHAFFQSRTRT
jgi:hypothetical protein